MSSENKIKSLGIIAGGGTLPDRLAGACEELEISPFIIALEGQTDECVYQEREYAKFRLGQAAAIIDTLKNHDIKDIALIGSIRRPSLAELCPDLRTAALLTRIGFTKALGDDGLLKAIGKELESEGFVIHGIDEFISEMLATEGTFGKYSPSEGDVVDIERGIEVMSSLGKLDIGQALIVQEGIVLGVEAAEGTDALIKRCIPLKREGRGGVLVKFSKQEQAHKLDLPTIGLRTLENCFNAGLEGIAVQAGKTLIADREELVRYADEKKFFIVGVKLDW